MSEQKEYKGVKYQAQNGKWKVVWPSGVSSISAAASEEALKAQIDSIANG